MNKSEHRIQQECVLWFNNTYPKLRGLLCYNNNNSVGGYRGKQNKFLGVVKGRSDLVLYYGGRAYMIELKDYKGRQKNEQKDWQSLVESNGFTYDIARNLKQFQMIVKAIVEECICTPNETTGWIEEAGHKSCNICGKSQGLMDKL